MDARIRFAALLPSTFAVAIAALLIPVPAVRAQDRLLEQKPAGPVEVRVARLVTDLLNTLEPDRSTQSLSAAEWIAEIERRARAALAGEPAISWDEARKRIENSFTRE